jgi:hypothetical protein
MNKPSTTRDIPSNDDLTRALGSFRNAWPECRFDSLKSACELGVEEGRGFPLSDIKRVEAMAELLDGHGIACDYVVELWNGQRAYLNYYNHFDGQKGD